MKPARLTSFCHVLELISAHGRGCKRSRSIQSWFSSSSVRACIQFAHKSWRRNWLARRARFRQRNARRHHLSRAAHQAQDGDQAVDKLPPRGCVPEMIEEYPTSPRMPTKMPTKRSRIALRSTLVSKAGKKHDEKRPGPSGIPHTRSERFQPPPSRNRPCRPATSNSKTHNGIELRNDINDSRQTDQGPAPRKTPVSRKQLLLALGAHCRESGDHARDHGRSDARPGRPH